MPRIFYIIVAIFVTNITFVSVSEAKLQSFNTDGCSAFLDHPLIHPNHPQAITWAQCCLGHDIVYWRGGSKQERIEADSRLALCVEDNLDAVTGYLMWLGVRFGGSPTIGAGLLESPYPWRWGYGWEENFNYNELSAEQRKEVAQGLLEIKENLPVFAQQLGLYEQHMSYVEHILNKELLKFSDK